MSRNHKTITLDHAAGVVEKRDHPDAPGRIAKQGTRLRQLRNLGVPAAEVLEGGISKRFR